MKRNEAITLLDKIISWPDDKMADNEQIEIALAWQEVKAILFAYENALEIASNLLGEMLELPCNYMDIDPYMGTGAQSGEWCKENCSSVSGVVCWRKYLELKAADDGAKSNA